MPRNTQRIGAITADDLHLGSFSDNAPWSVAGNRLAWLPKIAQIRSSQLEVLPKLTSRPMVPPLQRAGTVVRVLGIAVSTWALKERGSDQSQAAIALRVRQAAERLGPTYIKLAQIISAGEGVFPRELVNECRKCRDQVPAVPYQAIVEVIESDFGQPLHKIFRYIDPEPIAAASIAQVHSAVLISGERVAVKVQRPGIRQLVVRDLKVLSWLAPLLVGRIPVAALANPPALVKLFAETIVEELDFQLEAANMLDIAGVFAELDQRNFVVPRPHPELVSERVLVMEFMDGFAFDDALGMRDAGLDTEAIIKTAALGFLEGAFLHGVFHGDLHGGNLFVQTDGRIALVDFGITGRLSESDRVAFLRMMLTSTMNDMHGQVSALRDLGALPFDTDVSAVVSELGLEDGPIDPTKMDPEAMVGELQRVVKALLGYGARIPKPLMLYIKNLIFIDGSIAELAPDLDLFEIVTEIATHFATTHGAAITSQLGMVQTDWALDLDGLKGSFGVDPTEIDRLTYAELQERRALIRKRLARHRKHNS